MGVTCELVQGRLVGLSTRAVSKEPSDRRRDVRPAARAATRRIANPDPIDRAEEGLVNERNGYHKTLTRPSS